MRDTGDYLSDTWTTTEKVAWRETVPPTLAGISLFFCVVAQVIFYKFPRLRVFPRSLLSWQNYFNIYECIYIILKWVPGTPWHQAFATNIKPGSIGCRLGVFIDYSLSAGQFSCNTLLSLTIFLTVVCRIDIDTYKTKFFWSFLGFAIFYPFGMASIASTGWSTGWHEGDSCTLTNSAANLALRLPAIFFFSVQIFFLGSSLLYIRKIFASVHATAEFPLSYLFVRFTAMFMVQVFTIVPVLVLQLAPDTGNNAIFTRFAYSSRVVGPIPDSLILIAGNVDFVNWAKKKYVALLRKGSTPPHSVTFLASNHSTTTDPAPMRKEYSIEVAAIAMEELRLPTSAVRMGASTPSTLDLPSKASLEDESDVDPENVV